MIWSGLFIAALLAGLIYAELRNRRRLQRLVPSVPTPLPVRARLLPDLLGVVALVLLLWPLPAAAPAVSTPAQQPAIALVVDVSHSMQAADPVEPRMLQAKREIMTLLDILPSARFAVIPFAGEPVLQVPLTGDRRGLRFFIDNLHPGLVTAPGSAPEEAVQLAQSLLEESGGQRLIILISDGERTLAGPPPQLSDKIPVFGIQTGTITGARIGDLEAAISRADPQRLAAIAGRTGGRVLTGERLTPAALDLPQFLTQPEELSRRSAQLPLVVALLLLALRWVPPPLPLRGASPLVLVALLVVLLPVPGCDRSTTRSDDPRAVFETGLQARQGGDLERAARIFAAAADQLDGRQRGLALYNLGTVRLEQGQAADAVMLLEQALLLMPGDDASRDNLLLALKQAVAVVSDQGTPDHQESGSGNEMTRLQARQLLDSARLDPSAPPGQSPARLPTVLKEW